MTYSVYQHWDPLRTCVVGRSWPPEYYSWIKIPHVRSLFEKIAIETEEDYQAIIHKLESFGVEVIRPQLPHASSWHQGEHYTPPPMNPRDFMVMIGDRFYRTPDSEHQRHDMWTMIDQRVAAQGNSIHQAPLAHVNGANVSRIGRDLFFSTETYDDNLPLYQTQLDREFTHTRNHVVNTGGHGDSTYCPICPGLIISLKDVPTYQDTFPGWEVVYLPHQSWDLVRPFLELKRRNRGRWWIPGFENDPQVIDTVETWLKHWTGYVEETVFDINMLIVDPKNVLVFNHNKLVFHALERYGITPHVVTFRHRYFWDGGIHCITSDLDRSGHMQDYFPDRS